MTRLSIKSLTLFMLVVMFSAACSISSPAAVTTPLFGATPSTLPSGASMAQPNSLPAGDFNLPTPETGLNALSSYQSVLKITFQGEQDNVQRQWSKTYTLTFSAADKARILSIDGEGQPDAPSQAGWLGGMVGGTQYMRSASGAPCAAVFSERAPQLPELAAMLPPLEGAVITESEEAAGGVAALHYRFDQRALQLDAASAQVKGDVWVAKSGGYVLKYILTIDDPQGSIDPDMKGVLSREYTLKQGENAALLQVLPKDCPADTSALPLPAGASQVSSQPGYLSFATTLDLPAVANFYQAELPKAGYQPAGEPSIGEEGAKMAFAQGDRRLTLLAGPGKDSALTYVQLFVENGETEVTEVILPTAEASSAPSQDVIQRISNALNLTASTDGGSVFPSYHLELSEEKPTQPGADGQVGSANVQMSADAKDKAIHLFYHETRNGVPVEDSEGYIINDQDYEVKNGQVQESLMGVSAQWLNWQLDVSQPLMIAAAGPEAQGTESIDGRTAEKYALDSARADPAGLEMLKGFTLFNPSPTAAHGTIWIDQETGGLLKLILDYDAEFKDASGKSIGSSHGRIEITITKIGQVEVKLP